MKDYSEKSGYKASKPAIERHALYKRINKKYGFEYLLKVINKKIEKTPKSQIDDRKILRFDLEWVKKELLKLKKS